MKFRSNNCNILEGLYRTLGFYMTSLKQITKESVLPLFLAMEDCTWTSGAKGKKQAFGILHDVCMATVRTKEGAEQKSEAIDSRASSHTEHIWCCCGGGFWKMAAQLCERKKGFVLLAMEWLMWAFAWHHLVRK